TTAVPERAPVESEHLRQLPEPRQRGRDPERLAPGLEQADAQRVVGLPVLDPPDWVLFELEGDVEVRRGAELPQRGDDRLDLLELSPVALLVEQPSLLVPSGLD